MKNTVLFMLMVAVLNVEMVQAQRPVGDTIIGAEPTYMYGIYDWWRCANHDPEAPQWYTDTSDPLFSRHRHETAGGGVSASASSLLG